MRLEHLLIFGTVMAATWVAATYFWPRMLLSVFKRAILVKGFGDGPVPVNTLYTQSEALFADPLDMPAGTSKVAAAGVNRDTLLTLGWLDLSKGPLVLHVPDMGGRYYSVQFTNPHTNTNFAYVGKRTTGTGAGDFLITGPGSSGAIPEGVRHISSPTRSVLLIGRVLVYNDADLPTAHGLASQLRLSPLR
ncbi:DUF1254 domain-containing protein [Arthrobacter sp. SAFR-044]|uniref:DUF1254 domain-containing protein n=1 Tax=Arthrobacter sp. SAFR-044 TaxID=3387278 RepID=UPI003F7B5AEA